MHTRADEAQVQSRAAKAATVPLLSNSRVGYVADDARHVPSRRYVFWLRLRLEHSLFCATNLPASFALD